MHATVTNRGRTQSSGRPQRHHAPAATSAEEHPRLSLALPSARRVQVVVFDVQGKHVRFVRDGILDAGEHSISWDLQDDQGREAPRGVYFLKAWALGMVTRARLVVLDR